MVGSSSFIYIPLVSSQNEFHELICEHRRIASDEMADDIFANDTALHILSLSPSPILIYSLFRTKMKTVLRTVLCEILWIYPTI